MSNKKIYRGLNKRHRFKFRKFIVTFICIALIFGYVYNELDKYSLLKNTNISSSISSIADKVCFWKNINLEAFKLKPDEPDKTTITSDTSTKDKENSNTKTTSSEDENSTNTEVATVESLNVYLIQAGSFDKESTQDLKYIQNKLDLSNIPSSSVQIDGKNKLQSYMSFDESQVRARLPEVRGVVQDAFVSKLEIPVLSLEYTSEYDYISDISKYMNSLLESYKKESEYLNENPENIDDDSFIKILNDRKNIIDKLEIEVNKIDYEELSSFKENLLSYTSQIKGNITDSLTNSKKNNLYKVESNLISSIQSYYNFIDNIKSS